MAKLQPETFHVYQEESKENYPFKCKYGEPYDYIGVEYFVNNEKVFGDNVSI